MAADVCKYKRWSSAEDQQLRALVSQRRTSAQVAQVMGRTVKSVEGRRSYLKLRAISGRSSASETASDVEAATKRALAALEQAYRVTHAR